MLNKFLKTVEKHRMLEKGEGVVVGVSGGPDSVCLLHLLWRIKDMYDLKLYAVHLNHRFRGEEADADAAYVKEFCDKLDIPSFIFSEDIARYSREKGISFEEAGRERRYQLFYQVMAQQGAGKIAVAQNMDDQAETVLMRFMRGSGLEGLGAISYVRDHTIIRPLLDTSRKEIEDYCEAFQLKPRIDKTNLEAIYTRNRIRLELIPYIEKHFNSKIKETLWRTANLFREDREWIELSVQKNFEEAARKEKDAIRVDCQAIRKMHPAMGKRVLRRALQEVCGGLADTEHVHIAHILELVHKGNVGAKIDLPKGMMAELGYGVLMIKKRRAIDPVEFIYPLDIGESLYLPELNATVTSKIIPLDQWNPQDKHPYKKYFDLEKIEQGIIIRNRRSGDRFVPYGMQGRKKLKDYFIDEKVPREMRDRIPLVCDGHEIMWVVGYRTSERYKIDPQTQKVLVLEWKFQNKPEEMP